MIGDQFVRTAIVEHLIAGRSNRCSPDEIDDLEREDRVIAVPEPQDYLCP
jgi:hypothetical protein